MREKLNLFLLGFAPLPIGWVLVKVTALLLGTGRGPLIETLIDLLGALPFLLLWPVTRLAFRSRSTIRSTLSATALFLLPGLLMLALPGKLPACFFYTLDFDITLTPWTQAVWQTRLLSLMILGFAFWIGRRLPNLSDVNDYYQYGLLRMALGLVRYYYSHLSNDHGTADTMLLDPFFVIAGLPLVWLQFKAGWNILRGLFIKENT